jgi:outer membrane protein OmpA-like peptidoglycan-associated protein
MKLIFSAMGCLVFFISSAQLPISFRDEFIHNALGWPTGDDDTYSIKITNGKYVFNTSSDNSSHYATLESGMLTQKDFSIEASFVQRTGCIDNGFGLVWGDNGAGKRFEFVVRQDGYYKIKNAEGDEQINKWLATEVNPLNEPNVLKIEAASDKWYYYINNTEVAVTDATPLYGTRMGIVTYDDMIVEVDDFTFRQDKGIHLPSEMVYGLVKENLGVEVNSVYEELGPIILAGGNTLYFGVKHSPDNIGGVKDGEDIWYSKSNDGLRWLPRKNLGSEINDAGTNNLADISEDGNTLLFCQSDGFMLRKRLSKGWSKPEHIRLNILNEAELMEGNLSSDGKAILFTAKLKKNIYYSTDFNEKDIYVTLLTNGGKWTEPINLGEYVNTAGDEISPFLAADDRTLYFGSNGHPGYGSYDIFMTKRIGESWTEWTAPVNLGPEINGIGFDAYYTVSAKADYAYMVSNTNSFGKSDIVRIRMPETIKPNPVIMLNGKTLDVKTLKPVATKIIFELADTKQDLGLTLSDREDGNYTRIVNPNRYTLKAVAEGYLPVSEELIVEKAVKYTEIKKDFYLTPIEEGMPVRLTRVYFYQGKADLKPESYPELDQLVETLQLNPTVKIELAGHTDNVGNMTALMQLSAARVAEVKAYLVNKGINKYRIGGRGYGPSQPIVPNDTEENREKNRRVEFKIVKK